MNVYFGKPVIISDMQGPCEDGFHVPLSSEWQGLKSIMDGLGLTTGTNWRINLHMPFAGYRKYSTSLDNQGSYGRYWSSSPYSSSSATNARYLYLDGSSVHADYDLSSANGYTVRCFKNLYVAPDSSWTVVQGTLGSAGIFWDQSEGLISVTNGTTGYTIQDKNLGATTVYNNGDTLTQANMGNMYQWGNNYGFPSTGSVSNTSSTQVNASVYGPGNYYESSTWITTTPRDSSNNVNIRGGVSQGSGIKGVEVQNIYIGEYENPERIEYKMNADSNGNLYVPIAGYSTSGSQDCPYSWKISVDGGAETTYSGTGSSGNSITLSGYTAGSSHIIKIVPATEDYGWARAYSWRNTSGRTYITEIVYDSSYMGYATSATNTGNYFRYLQYNGCNLLTNPAEEYMPDTVTTIGNNFMNRVYTNCTSLTYASEESLPSSVTSIGTVFRGYQYQGCTALTEIKGWKDLSIGNLSYRQQQFYNCTSNKTVKVLSNVGYSSYDANTLENSYVTSVNVPSAYLSNFTGASNQPRSGITDSKFVGY